MMRVSGLVFLYLLGGLAANWSLSYFGPEAAIYNAFLFIGLLLVCRDRLQDLWEGQVFLRMSFLIGAGTVIALIFNPAGGRIALAGAGAFVATETVDTVVYRLREKRAWLERCNVSNLAAALVDSVLFPLFAFGTLSAATSFDQFVAKVSGGLVFSLLFLRWLGGRRKASGPALTDAGI